jgi:ATP/maltotriose-dependent transcriptional regulator MalT
MSRTEILSIAVGRLVPILFGLSFTLVAARVVADRVSRRERMSWLVFVLVAFLGCLLVTPFAVRSAVLVDAEIAVRSGDPSRARARIEAYQDLGGTLRWRRAARWSLFLVRFSYWKETERILSKVLDPSEGVAEGIRADLWLVLGLSAYHLEDLARAENALLHVGKPRAETVYLRDYILGRVLARRGTAQLAARAYESALERYPGFIPALYQLIRLRLQAGDLVGARQLATRLPRGAGPSPVVDLLDASVAEGVPPPEREFIVALR